MRVAHGGRSLQNNQIGRRIAIFSPYPGEREGLGGRAGRAGSAAANKQKKSPPVCLVTNALPARLHNYVCTGTSLSFNVDVFRIVAARMDWVSFENRWVRSPNGTVGCQSS